MTLGGLALAVGILVDEATVEVENIHTQMEQTDSIAQAVRLGNAETAVPRLLAMLCILAVFIPSFFMQGAARALFVPLSLAVGFAMIASYLLSSTFVPVLSIWLLRAPARGRRGTAGGSPFDAARDAYGAGRRPGSSAGAGLVVPAYLVVAPLVDRPASAAGSALEIFPQVDAGQFQLRCGPRPARASSRPRRSPSEALDVDQARRSAPDNVEISLGYVGADPVELPDQHRLPVDQRAGGSGPAGRSEARAAAASVERCEAPAKERAAARRARPSEHAGACGSRSSRPTSSTR